jgi:psiF repeat-containing protein
MRALLPTIAACLLLSLGAVFAAALAAPPSDSPKAPAAAPAAAATPATGTAADSDAAAKHAKRTACLKNAKAKKLVGAQRTAFIKDCVAAP